MPKSQRQVAPHRLLTSAAVGAALVAGVAAFAAPANAAQPTTPGHPTTVAQFKFGARSAPFSPPGKTANTAGVRPADIAATPWVVGISTGDPGGPTDICTGTVISPTKVVTAADCTVPHNQNQLQVIAGRDNLWDDSVGFVDGVTSTFVAPSYLVGSAYPNGFTGSNIEVLTLSTPLPSVYTPIGLSAQGDESPYAAGGTVTTLGYGLDYQQPGDEMQLSQGTLTSQAASVCQGVSFPADEEVCELSNDSRMAPAGPHHLGDPLVANGKLIGVGSVYDDNQPSHVPFERMSVLHDMLTADAARTAPGNQSWLSDGVSDLLGLNGSGQLTYFEGYGAYPGSWPNGNPGFSNQFLVDNLDWNTSYQKLVPVTDWDHDGQEGLLAVEHDGNLDFYPRSYYGEIEFGAVQHVGTGWNQFSNIVAINNFTGDGRLSLIAAEPDGTLRLYERNGNGWLNGNGVQIGSGFNQFTHLTAFQWTDNGHIGLLGDTSNGQLRFYAVDGGGHWVNGNGQTIGSGFDALPSVLSVGSFGGTDTGSLMTVDWSGNLSVYLANGKGGWVDGNGTLIGVGFQTMESVF